MSDYSTIQDLRAFDESIFDLVDEYLTANKSIDKNDGILINPANLSIEIIRKEDVENTNNFIHLSSLIRKNEEENCLEVDIDATFELAGKYVFVI